MSQPKQTFGKNLTSKLFRPRISCTVNFIHFYEITPKQLIPFQRYNVYLKYILHFLERNIYTIKIKAILHQ